MLLVGHRVARSEIHGLGVFTTEPINAGDVVWRFDPMFDVEIPAAMLTTMDQDEIETVLHHAEYIIEQDVFRLGNDGDMFMNHCNDASLIDCGDEMRARRYLPAGTELTCDYAEVCVIGFSSKIAPAGELQAL